MHADHHKESDDALNGDSPKRQRFTPVPGEQEPSQSIDAVIQTSSGVLGIGSVEAGETKAGPTSVHEQLAVLLHGKVRSRFGLL